MSEERNPGDEYDVWYIVGWNIAFPTPHATNVYLVRGLYRAGDDRMAVLLKEEHFRLIGIEKDEHPDKPWLDRWVPKFAGQPHWESCREAPAP